MTQKAKLDKDVIRTVEMLKAYEQGVRAAAAFASEFDHTQTHPYRMEDVILAKIGLISKKKMRKNKRLVYDHCTCFFCTMSRMSGVCMKCQNQGGSR